jgi:hypothetical protein
VAANLLQQPFKKSDNNVHRVKRVDNEEFIATSGSRMERGMDGMEPAAATNSAVFPRNRFGMCCDENILALEATQAMSQYSG